MLLNGKVLKKCIHVNFFLIFKTLFDELSVDLLIVIKFIDQIPCKLICGFIQLLRRYSMNFAVSKRSQKNLFPSATHKAFK